VAVDFTPHFSLEELSRSDVALRRGWDNTPNAGEQANLRRLCETLLEPVRVMLGVTVQVSSGFRSPMLNQAIGGAAGSAHMDGRAADFVPQGISLQEAFDEIRLSSLPYDQVIIECGAWIHLACAREGENPRRMALKASGHAGAWVYTRVV
jgi:hypothetical protein